MIFDLFLYLLINCLTTFNGVGMNPDCAINRESVNPPLKAEQDTVSLPSLSVTVTNIYRHRPDGNPGRELILYFGGAGLFSRAEIDVTVNGLLTETYKLPGRPEGIEKYSLLLPNDVGVNHEAEVSLTLRVGNKVLHKSISVPSQRQWTVYIYPHSHVDVGYSNTQENAEIIHKRNLINGARLSEETQNNPEGSRYTWNPEVLWPVERYLKNADTENKKYIINAIRKRYISPEASYLNVNTSACSEEELFRLFGFRNDLQKETGTSINTFVQVDIPGITWGIIPIFQQLGIKYVYSIINGGARFGTAPELNYRPCWWIGPDGKSKVLFFQPGSYMTYSEPKGASTGRPWFGQIDPLKIPETIKTKDPVKFFLGENLFSMLNKLEKSGSYPYDIFSISWSLWDNTPLDEDLPAAVRSWNSEYAFPHLVIAGAQEIMATFEKKYGNRLPVLRGDYTEYWTDGLGSDAALTGKLRNTNERLIQAETLWTMLHPGETYPNDDFREAWRYTLLAGEHTWGYERTGIGSGTGSISWAADISPADKSMRDTIFHNKKEYFIKADDLSRTVLKKAFDSLKNYDDSYLTVFNTQSWLRGGLITLSPGQSKQGDLITEESGIVVLSQRLENGELVFLASDIPAFGSKIYRIRTGAVSSKSLCTINDTVASNGIITVRINPVTGNIISLKKSGSEHEYVNSKDYGGLNSFYQLPGGNSVPVGDSVISVRIKEKGPLLAEWEIESVAPGCKKIVRQIRLVAYQSSIGCTNTIDKQNVTDKEGIHFGFSFNISDPVFHIDIPCAVMRLEKDQIPEANRNWITFQRWLDVSDDQHGITWVSPDAPLFEAGGMTANIMGDGPGWIKHIERKADIFSWVLNNHWYTNFPVSQEGIITFRYFIMPHDNGFRPFESNRFGIEHSQPLIAELGRAHLLKVPVLSFKGSSSVFVSILKNEEINSTTIRLRSLSENDESVKLLWPGKTPQALYLCENENESLINVEDELVIPSNGILVLRARW
jgi:hypothetical protein